MRFSAVFFVLITTFTISLPVAAESVSGELMAKCPPPSQPTIPNGTQASEEEMIAAQRTMKAYLAEGDTYVECIKAVEQTWPQPTTEEQKAVIVLFHNKMIDDMQSVADMFNSSVRAFKGRK